MYPVFRVHTEITCKRLHHDIKRTGTLQNCQNKMRTKLTLKTTTTTTTTKKQTIEVSISSNKSSENYFIWAT